jgi:hypothetical protein
LKIIAKSIEVTRTSPDGDVTVKAKWFSPNDMPRAVPETIRGIITSELAMTQAGADEAEVDDPETVH